MKSAGNSGVFAWVPTRRSKSSSRTSCRSRASRYRCWTTAAGSGFAKRNPGKKDDWFTTNGDIFAVGKSKLEPFPPLSPDGSRSYPRKELSHGVGEWNHYYVRGVNGEMRLWVNGEEVSGGSGAEPRTGYLCLEAEGSPVEFRNIRVRELP